MFVLMSHDDSPARSSNPATPGDEDDTQSLQESDDNLRHLLSQFHTPDEGETSDSLRYMSSSTSHEYTGNVTNLLERWSLARRPVAFESLAWDVKVNQGQIRPLDQDRVKELEVDIITNRQIDSPAVVICWHNEQNDTYVLLSGQHMTAALNNIRRRALKAGYTQPRWLKEVDVTVLKYKTPVSVREAVAGQAQRATQNVQKTKLSDLVTLFQRELGRNNVAAERDKKELSVIWRAAFEKVAYVDKESPHMHLDVCCVTPRACFITFPCIPSPFTSSTRVRSCGRSGQGSPKWRT